jgi:hypothetical protein
MQQKKATQWNKVQTPLTLEKVQQIQKKNKTRNELEAEHEKAKSVQMESDFGGVAEYANGVFATDGQSNVEGWIGGKLTPELIARLKASGDVLAVYGFHGTGGGKCGAGAYLARFEKEEMDQARKKAYDLESAKVIKGSKIIQDKEDFLDYPLRRAIEEGNVFFTWCDAKTYVECNGGGRLEL